MDWKFNRLANLRRKVFKEQGEDLGDGRACNFLGHRWAMIGAMIVWTAEKIISLSDTMTLTQSSGGLIVSQLVWWALYMHAFYFAFRIEQGRKTIGRSKPPPS